MKFVGTDPGSEFLHARLLHPPLKDREKPVFEGNEKWVLLVDESKALLSKSALKKL